MDAQFYDDPDGRRLLRIPIRRRQGRRAQPPPQRPPLPKGTFKKLLSSRLIRLTLTEFELICERAARVVKGVAAESPEMKKLVYV